MANDSAAPAGLSFPDETFAKLTPTAYLAAHLRQQSGNRANGRRSSEFRTPNINVGSLSHTHGSAVVRLGDTAVVCGIRGEILLASAIPNYPHDTAQNNDLLDRLGLVVPNVELSTGCSPSHLPGNPPGSLAQALSYRISSLIYVTDTIKVRDLRIEHNQVSHVEESSSADRPTLVTKAFWALYVDILCLALDGNVFDAAWLAVVAALRDTRLPGAQWDEDREVVICSPLSVHSKALELPSTMPVSSTFVVFGTSSPFKKGNDVENWLLADPDATEEDASPESITITLWSTGLGHSGGCRIEKSGGTALGISLLKRCIAEAESRREIVHSIVCAITG